MYQLIETIKVVDGQLMHLDDHINRMRNTRSKLFNKTDYISLDPLIDMCKCCLKGLYKCRIEYHHEIESIEIAVYKPKEIKSLQLVHDDYIQYPHKFANRADIDRLYEFRGKADDILIIKEGLITDSSYTNVALWDGKTWFTPKKPLLPGTHRARLLSNQTITEKNIPISKLKKYQKICLFNAMLDFGTIEIDIPKGILN